MSIDLSRPFRGSAVTAAGVVSAGQLRRSRFQRLFPDVYVLASSTPDLAVRSLAAHVLVEGCGVLAGYSAAELLGASCGPDYAPAEVSVPGSERRSRPGLLVHRFRPHAGEIEERNGIRMTTPLRTAYDLARRLDFGEAVVAVDALAHRRFAPAAVLELAAGHRGDRGVKRLRAVATTLMSRSPAAPACNPTSSAAHSNRRLTGVATVERMVGSEVRMPYLELLAGGVWWTVGAGVLDSGTGTVVLAAGLGITGSLFMAVRRRHGSGAPLPPGGRARLLRLVAVAVVLGALVVGSLTFLNSGELAVPAVCVLVGAVLVALSSQLDQRSVLAVGAALMVLGAVGALLALNSAGLLYPQGVVGLGAGISLWTAAGYRTGLLAELRGRVER